MAPRAPRANSANRQPRANAPRTRVGSGNAGRHNTPTQENSDHVLRSSNGRAFFRCPCDTKNPHWTWVADIHQSKRDNKQFKCAGCSIVWSKLFDDARDRQVNPAQNDNTSRPAAKPKAAPKAKAGARSPAQGRNNKATINEKPSQWANSVYDALQTSSATTIEELQATTQQAIQRLREQEELQKKQQDEEASKILLTENDMRILLGKKKHTTEVCKRKLSKVERLKEQLATAEKDLQEHVQTLRDFNKRIKAHNDEQERQKQAAPDGQTNRPSPNPNTIGANNVAKVDQVYNQELLDALNPEERAQATHQCQHLREIATQVAEMQKNFCEKMEAARNQAAQLKAQRAPEPANMEVEKEKPPSPGKADAAQSPQAPGLEGGSPTASPTKSTPTKSPNSDNTLELLLQSPTPTDRTAGDQAGGASPGGNKRTPPPNTNDDDSTGADAKRRQKEKDDKLTAAVETMAASA